LDVPWKDLSELSSTAYHGMDPATKRFKVAWQNVVDNGEFMMRYEGSSPQL
jgi:hypothetical protein